MGEKGGIDVRMFNYKEIIFDVGEKGEIIWVKIMWVGLMYLWGEMEKSE